MAKRRSVFVLSQHNIGMGHLTRASALAEAIAERLGADVTLFSGGPPIAGYAPPRGARFVQLPAIRRLRAEGVSIGPVEEGRSLDEVVAERAAILAERVRRARPQAVVIEHYPFSPHHYAGTVEPFLDACAAVDPAPLLVASVRDAPIGCHMPDFRAVAAGANERLRTSFTMVWHHTDPRVFPGGEIEGFDEAVRGVRVAATGYVRRRWATEGDGEEADEGILLTAGGGRDGAETLEALVAGAARVEAPWGRPVRVVVGPLMPDEGRVRVRAAARAAGAEVCENLPSLETPLRESRVVACMGGYNSIVEAIALGKPLLVLPRLWSYEQKARVAALEARGLVRSMGEERADADLVARRLEELDRFRPAFRPDTEGAARSADLLAALLDGRGASSAPD